MRASIAPIQARCARRSAPRAFAQLRALLTHLAAREVGEDVRGNRACHQRVQMSRRPNLPMMSAATQSSLIPASSNALVQAVGFAGRSSICVLR
jgi:hypothetical protein